MIVRKCLLILLMISSGVILYFLYGVQDKRLWFLKDKSSSSFASLNTMEACILSFFSIHGLSGYLSLSNESYPLYRSFHKKPLKYDNVGKECSSRFYRGQENTSIQPFLKFCFYPFTLSTKQKEMLHRTLRIVKEGFHSRKIELVLTGGSFIGSWRYHRMIPYDDDIDFYILRDQKAEAKQLLESLSLNKSNRFVFSDTESSNQHWKLGVLCEGSQKQDCFLEIDFFFMWREESVMKFLEWPGSINVEDYYPLKPRPFEGILFKSPRNFEAYMRRQYSETRSDMCQFKNHANDAGLCVRPRINCDLLRHVYPYKVSGMFRNLSVELIVHLDTVTDLFVFEK